MNNERYVTVHHHGLSQGPDKEQMPMPASSWIPVSERLPKPSIRVLVSDEGVVDIAYVTPTGKWRCSPTSTFRDGAITYWRSLPDPPQ